MTTSLYIDKDTKQKASQKARRDKLSFSAVVRILLSDYADGKIIIGSQPGPHYAVSEVSVDKKTQAKMDMVISKWRTKKK